MLVAVERGIQQEPRWPRRMVQRLEDLRRGLGLRWASQCLKLWIELTNPDGDAVLLRLITVAEEIGLNAADSTSLIREARRVWYLPYSGVFPQRAVSRMYEALAALAEQNPRGYVSSLAAAIFIAATRQDFTEEMFRELQDTYDRLSTERNGG